MEYASRSCPSDRAAPSNRAKRAELVFFAAAREVTGSCQILRLGGRTVLLDCGMFQGRHQESREKHLRPPIPAERIDAVASFARSHPHPQPPNGAAAVIMESTYSPSSRQCRAIA